MRHKINGRHKRACHFLMLMEDEGFDFIFAIGENQCCDQYLHWSQQLSTGQLHLDRFESLPNTKKSPTAKAVRDFLAEDEGFEPPQTESESGVLPLHKSSIC